MPRKAGLDAVGTLQHIIIRGVKRRKIFQDEGDRNSFLERLGHTLNDTRAQCYARAQIAMPAHRLLTTGLVTIATVMRRLLIG